MLTRIILSILLILCLVAQAQSQYSITVPPNSYNNRFYTDVFKDNIVRPALSVRGFDSSSLTGGSNYGLGLKQILDKYLNGDNAVVFIINSPSFSDNILSESTASLDIVDVDNDPNAVDVINRNAHRIQAKAFEALASYILEKNSITGVGFRNHSTALSDFKTTILDEMENGFLMAPSILFDLPAPATILEDIDPVKLPESVMNVARAIDLYLALENAYKFYGDAGNSSDSLAYYSETHDKLLTKTEKKDLLNYYNKSSTIIHAIHTTQYWKLLTVS